MSNPLEQFIPDEKEFWHYHEPSGIILLNDPDYGWLGVSNPDLINLQLEELEEVLEQADENDVTLPGDITDEESLEAYMERMENESE